jgi:alkylhydroperoxidase family enzyme
LNHTLKNHFIKEDLMARIRLLKDEELAATPLSQVQAIEQAGGDASVLRALGHRQDMFDTYFMFYYPSHEGGIVEADLKELVRLKIARLNDCST